jgi:hypothetical protein
MRILFAITALCFLVLLWAGLAIRRHVLAAAREREQRRERPQATAVIEVELKHELRTAHAEAGFFGIVTDPQASRHISRPKPGVRDSAIFAAMTSVPIFQPVQAPKVPEPMPVEPPVESSEASAVTEFRRPSAAISGAKIERLDWAHFNKDMGDLSDPYQVPRTANSSSAARNRS